MVNKNNRIMKDSKNIYNIEYWEDFYKSHEILSESLFAKFSIEKINELENKKLTGKLLDICCGGGRDSVFFHSNNIETYSFDINELNENLPQYFKYNLNDKERNFSLKEKMDYVYCRFVLHAVPENIEDYILVNSNSVLENDGLLLIEVRSNKGVVLDIIDDHYRRLSDLELLKSKLINLNFEIVHQEERNNLSPNDKEDPILIRIIAKKKGNPIPYNVRSFDETLDVIASSQEVSWANYNLDKLEAEHLLKTSKLIFDFHDIDFLLVFGTLLGAYREKDFITHDQDVDIAMLNSYKDKIYSLINQGYFKLHGISVSRENDYSLISLDNNKAFIDFYLFSEINPNLYKCGPYSLTQEQLFQKTPNKIIFKELEYSTVPNIEEYLMEKYGNDWKTPSNKHTKHAKT